MFISRHSYFFFNFLVGFVVLQAEGKAEQIEGQMQVLSDGSVVESSQAHAKRSHHTSQQVQRQEKTHRSVIRQHVSQIPTSGSAPQPTSTWDDSWDPSFDHAMASSAQTPTGEDSAGDDSAGSASGWTEQEFLLLGMKIALTAVLYFIGAIIYYECKAHPPALLPDQDREIPLGIFKYGLFSCFGDPKICLCGFFCTTCRWADTIRMAHFRSFWVAFLLMSLFTLIPFLFPGVIIVTMWYRHRIRKVFGMPHGECAPVCMDCLTSMFCFCCVVIQEARQLEVAYQANYPLIGEGVSVVTTTVHSTHQPGFFDERHG